MALSGIAFIGTSTASAAAGDCRGTFTIGVGGFQIDTSVFPPNAWQPSTYIPSDQPIGYDSLNITAGANELEKQFRIHRNACPGDHIKMLGHSGGAAVVHVWVSRNQFEPNATAILAADPKRAPGPGSGGIAGNPAALALDFIGAFRGAAGTDRNFGPFPVLDICNAGDWVCVESAGLHGYLNTGVHGKYDLNPHNYPNFARGNWFPAIY
ncbi:hypothetical protein ACWF99_23560 [Nocardia sp. NPDC055002]